MKIKRLVSLLLCTILLASIGAVTLQASAEETPTIATKQEELREALVKTRYSSGGDPYYPNYSWKSKMAYGDAHARACAMLPEYNEADWVCTYTVADYDSIIAELYETCQLNWDPPGWTDWVRYYFHLIQDFFKNLFQ